MPFSRRPPAGIFGFPKDNSVLRVPRRRLKRTACNLVLYWIARQPEPGIRLNYFYRIQLPPGACNSV